MKTKCLAKFGSVAVLGVTIALLYCFAILGVMMVILGMNIQSEYEDAMFYVMQGMVVLALVGCLAEYRTHRKVLPALTAIASASAIIYGMNSGLDSHYMFPGIIGLLVVSLWNSIEVRRAKPKFD